MNIRKVIRQDKVIAIVSGDEYVVTDPQSALDMSMSVVYGEGTELIAIDKGVISEDFFVLSSGLAGEVLQKFINYRLKVAIFGDFSSYTSEPLKALIRESNRGQDIFFVATEEEAIERLAFL